MAQPRHHKKSRNHFPDWLFYLISALLIVSLSLSISFYSKNKSLREVDIARVDSLERERIKVAELNGFYESQGKLVIKNTGSYDFTITDFYATYYDSETNSFKTIRGMINSTIAANGGKCSPSYNEGGDEPLWDGSVLFYFLSITGRDISGKGKNFYFSGKWEKDKKVIGISLDNGVNNLKYIYPKCL